MWIPPAHSPFTMGQALGALGAGASAVHALERELAERFRADRVVLTASGTHALELAVRAALPLAAEDRRRVALPAYSCFDLVTALLGAGAEVTFYDLDPETLVPDEASLKAAVEEGAGVVVAANLFGFPLDPLPLDGLRSSAGVLVIEDAAQGLGARARDREGGTLGDLTVLSFGRGKGWTGSGGGALLVRGARVDVGALAETLAPRGETRLSLAVRAAAQWALARPALFGLPARLPWLGLGETRFHAPTPARAIHPYQAGLVRRSAGLAGREVEIRRTRAAHLDRVLVGLPGIDLPRPLPGGEGGWLRRPFLMEGLPRELPRELHRLGVYRAYPRLLPDLWSEARGTPRGPIDHPGARRLVRALVTTPVHARTPLDHLADALPTAISRLAPQRPER